MSWLQAGKLASMKIQVEGGKLISFFLLTLAATTSAQNTECPFDFLYHFGDGVTDIGNSIHVSPTDPNPASLPPFGITSPGWPTGRWCDGLVDFDYTAIDFGLPNIVPYTTWPATESEIDGIIFSVARSPVLPLDFFEKRDIHIPSYAVPLEDQMSWFHKYLESTCQEECSNSLGNALFLMGDIEGNDLGYALTQGKSIEEAMTYVPKIVDELIHYSTELIQAGAKRLIIPGNGPLGCYPYILTALWTTDLPEGAYDELGCLNSVNDLVVYKNALLQKEIDKLQKEHPRTLILYGDMFEGVRQIINATSDIGDDGINKALKACCGIGGRYNYDSNRFCGSLGSTVCSNPNEYIYWDGLHFTQQAYYKMEHLLVQPALEKLKCKTSASIQTRGASARKASV